MDNYSEKLKLKQKRERERERERELSCEVLPKKVFAFIATLLVAYLIKMLSNQLVQTYIMNKRVLLWFRLNEVIFFPFLFFNFFFLSAKTIHVFMTM